ncbi:hypothetical protein J6590_081488 [Homalodisca vitripennis]|nr:hypothetical protein J6590_081488 [Homalodisca vitripennis]
MRSTADQPSKLIDNDLERVGKGTDDVGDDVVARWIGPWTEEAETGRSLGVVAAPVADKPVQSRPPPLTRGQTGHLAPLPPPAPVTRVELALARERRCQPDSSYSRDLIVFVVLIHTRTELADIMCTDHSRDSDVIPSLWGGGSGTKP